MAARSSWKGFIRLSLVSVPVKAYTATSSSADVSLHQLHAGCNNRIRYLKSCPEHGELKNEEIVKGYEYAKGEYVIIDENEMDKLRTESDHSLKIDGFIDSATVDPIYHTGKTYYLVPDGAVGQKPYALLLRAMTDRKLHAVGQVVLSSREQIVLLRPEGRMMVMTVLSHAADVKASSSFMDEISETELTDEEMKLTDILIGATTLANFDLGTYKDTYTEKLTKLIQMKVDGKEIVQVTNPEEPKIINLMEALKRSVAQAQAESGGEEPVAMALVSGENGNGAGGTNGKKMAPSARTRDGERSAEKKTVKKKVG
jgi:DNA end-binding protein Ku